MTRSQKKPKDAKVLAFAIVVLGMVFRSRVRAHAALEDFLHPGLYASYTETGGDGRCVFLENLGSVPRWFSFGLMQHDKRLDRRLGGVGRGSVALLLVNPK